MPESGGATVTEHVSGLRHDTRDAVLHLLEIATVGRTVVGHDGVAVCLVGSDAVGQVEVAHGQLHALKVKLAPGAGEEVHPDVGGAIAYWAGTASDHARILRAN